VLTAESTPPPYGNYHFTLSPFVDKVHVNVNGAYVINGIGVAGVTYPVLGKASGNNFYMALFLDQSYKLGLIVGTISTASGTIYRTMDGTSFVSQAVTLVPFTPTTVAVAESSGASVSASDAQMDGWPAQYHFKMNPFVDVVHVYVDGAGMINGQVTTSSYTAPLLGKASGDNFYMAIQYPGQLYKGAFLVGTVSTASGTLYRTIDGTSFISTPVTLTLTSPTSLAVGEPSGSAP
jgi:hypothetical protein